MNNIVTLANQLGIKPSEIDYVADSPAGTVIVTTDGVSYVDAVVPDAEGKTGLMLLAAPSEASVAVVDERTTWNGFQLFVSEDLVDSDETAVPSATGDEQAGSLADRTLDELTAIAAEFDIKPKGRSNAAKHDSLVEQLTVKYAELEAVGAGADDAAVLAVVQELDELTDDELADRAETAGVDVTDELAADRDALVAVVANAVVAAGQES